MHDLGRRSLGEELGARRVDLAVSRRRAVAERGPNNECVVDVARRHDVLLRVQLPVEQTVVARVGGDVLVDLYGVLCKVRAAAEESFPRHVRVETPLENRADDFGLRPVEQDHLVRRSQRSPRARCHEHLDSGRVSRPQLRARRRAQLVAERSVERVALGVPYRPRFDDLHIVVPAGGLLSGAVAADA